MISWVPCRPTPPGLQAPLLDMRRRFRAVMGVLDAMICNGVSLARSVELTAQWSRIAARIVALGPMYPVPLDLHAVQGLGLSDFFRVVSGIHRRLSDFIHSVVVHRRDEVIRVWRGWLREDPLVHPYKWLRPDLVPPVPFLQCKPHLTPGGSGVLADLAKIDEEFRKAWLPYSRRSGQREASLEEFSFEVEGWLPLLPVFELPRLTGQVLADVVQRKGATAGSLDGWGWRELKVLLVSWYDGLARILSLVEDTGIWPDGLLDAYITMIPETDGDATSTAFGPLHAWDRLKGLGFLSLSLVLVVVVVQLRPGIPLLLILRRFFLVLLILMSTFLLLMLSSHLIPLIVVS